MKKVLCIFAIVLILSTIGIFIHADHFAPTYSIVDGIAYVIDHGVLSIQEEDLLNEQVYEVVRKYHILIQIKVIDSLGSKSAQRYADNYYDDYLAHQYDGNGILLLIALEDREWAVTTNGETVRVITNNDIDSIMADVLPDLSSGNYYDAFSAFVDGVDREYQSFIPDEDTDGFAPWQILVVSLLIGIAIGGIVILIMRSGMKTARPQHSAVSYLQTGSYHLTQCLDLYLYSRTTRTAKPKNNGSGSSGGGSRGGRSGKF